MLQQVLTRKILSSPALARSVRLARPTFVDASIDDDWETWAHEMYPEKLEYSFSYGQRRLWKWMWTITPVYTPEAIAVLLARAGGKTTSLDLSISGVLGRKQCMFVLIVSANMDKAKARVKSIGSLLTSSRFRTRYPDVSEPALGQKSYIKAWNERLLMTESGQTVMGASLGSDNRGYNLESGDRPDLIVLDDIDKTYDSDKITTRKINQIVTEILPTEGTKPAAVIFTQNLIRLDGVADQLVQGETEWLSNRILVGPIKAIEGLEYEKRVEQVRVDNAIVEKVRHVITAGTATWEGQSIEACQAKIDKWGISTFEHEQQHNVTDFKGALLSGEHFRYTSETFDLACLGVKVVGVDPAGGSTHCGIVCSARIPLNQYCILEDASVRTDIKLVDDWADTAVLVADFWGAAIAVETDYGGTLATDPIRQAIKKLKKSKRITQSPVVIPVRARNTGSKRVRAIPIAKMHKDGNVVYLYKSTNSMWKGQPYRALLDGHFDKTKAEWTTWVEGETKGSPNRLDAEVHSIATMNRNSGKVTRGGPGYAGWIA